MKRTITGLLGSGIAAVALVFFAPGALDARAATPQAKTGISYAAQVTPVVQRRYRHRYNYYPRYERRYYRPYSHYYSPPRYRYWGDQYPYRYYGRHYYPGGSVRVGPLWFNW